MADGADLYGALGGSEGCRRLAVDFYTRAARDRVLRRLFSGSLHCAVEGLATFLTQFLGGPSEYSPRRWHLSLREAHERFAIGTEERDAWMETMRQTLDALRICEPARGALLAYFEQTASAMVNRGPAPAAAPAAEMPPEIAGPAANHAALEETVAAIRRGNARRALELAGSPAMEACFERDRAALPSLLALMVASGDAALVEYAQQRVVREPAVAREPYTYGRTLLHGAAAAGSLEMVEMLLRLDAGAADRFGHTPLHCAANECAKESAAAVVRALLAAGADVNARDRAQQCTALHIAARRGNVGISRALIEGGADLEARDRRGDTPLRRAVNCSKPLVAALLIANGADAGSTGSKGLTPRQAARTAAMRRALEPHSDPHGVR